MRTRPMRVLLAPENAPPRVAEQLDSRIRWRGRSPQLIGVTNGPRRAETVWIARGDETYCRGAGLATGRIMTEEFPSGDSCPLMDSCFKHQGDEWEHDRGGAVSAARSRSGGDRRSAALPRENSKGCRRLDSGPRRSSCGV